MSNRPLLELSDCAIEGDLQHRRLARQAELRQILEANPDVAKLFENIFAEVLVDTEDLKLEWDARAAQLRAESLRRSSQSPPHNGEGWIDELGNFLDEARGRQLERDIKDTEDRYDRLAINMALQRSQRKAEIQRTMVEHPELAQAYEEKSARLRTLVQAGREYRNHIRGES